MEDKAKAFLDEDKVDSLDDISKCLSNNLMPADVIVIKNEKNYCFAMHDKDSQGSLRVKTCLDIGDDLTFSLW